MVALIATFNLSVKQDTNKLSGLALANVEALADGESDSVYQQTTTKQIIRYIYGSDGKLESTETYSVYYCIKGGGRCPYDPC